MTRVPYGMQDGCPSLLDYATLRNCSGLGSIDWRVSSSDHAYVAYDIDVPVTACNVRPKRTWTCSSNEGFMAAIQRWELDTTTTFKEFLLTVSNIQHNFRNSANCRAKRRARMPFQLRCAIQQQHAATSLDQREHWMKLAFMLRRKWVNDLN